MRVKRGLRVRVRVRGGSYRVRVTRGGGRAMWSMVGFRRSDSWWVGVGVGGRVGVSGVGVAGIPFGSACSRGRTTRPWSRWDPPASCSERQREGGLQRGLRIAERVGERVGRG